ncbi:MAG: nucleotide exchange factor GrpE [Bacteroidota bacterium]
MSDRPSDSPAPDAADGDAQALRDLLRSEMSNEDPADVAVDAIDDIAEQAAANEQLHTDVARLHDENKDLQEQLLRRAAEFQNYRRRSEGDRKLAEQRGRDAVLNPVLDVIDDFRRSLEASRQAAEQAESTTPAFDALLQGVELVYQKFEGALERLGVEEIEAIGKPFDENEHEAVVQQPAPEGTASGTVLAEIQPGYRQGDRVIRHARVIVAQ